MYLLKNMLKEYYNHLRHSKAELFSSLEQKRRYFKEHREPNNICPHWLWTKNTHNIFFPERMLIFGWTATLKCLLKSLFKTCANLMHAKSLLYLNIHAFKITKLHFSTQFATKPLINAHKNISSRTRLPTQTRMHKYRLLSASASTHLHNHKSSTTASSTHTLSWQSSCWTQASSGVSSRTRPPGCTGWHWIIFFPQTWARRPAEEETPHSLSYWNPDVHKQQWKKVHTRVLKCPSEACY